MDFTPRLQLAMNNFFLFMNDMFYILSVYNYIYCCESSIKQVNICYHYIITVIKSFQLHMLNPYEEFSIQVSTEAHQY